MQKNLLTVTQLNRYIRGVFEDELLLSSIGIYGEVSNFSIHSGSAYFTLRDSECAINCIIFKPNPNYIPLDGDSVRLIGTPKYHLKGKLTFIATDLKPHGEGEILLKLQMLKRKLESEGVFDHKKPHPKHIKRIGVITSGTGAVIYDIINIVRRRQPSLDIVVFDARVQGDSAVSSIVNAINCASKTDIDALIIARGGGSSEDLEAFNAEAVARAVADCKKYTVSAVGHETNTTLCDFAADLRAPTPSAAAELLTIDQLERAGRVYQLANALVKKMQKLYSDKKSALLMQSTRLNLVGVKRLATAKERVRLASDRLSLNAQTLVSNKANCAHRLTAELNAINPLKLVERGYFRVLIEDKPLISAHRVQKGDRLSVAAPDGVVHTLVDSVQLLGGNNSKKGEQNE